MPKRVNEAKIKILSSLVYVKYTTYMRGVDVANHLQGEYSCQVQSHKWWHRIFFLLLDATTMNFYILHCNCCAGLAVPPLTYLQFLQLMTIILTDFNLTT